MRLTKEEMKSVKLNKDGSVSKRDLYWRTMLKAWAAQKK